MRSLSATSIATVILASLNLSAALSVRQTPGPFKQLLVRQDDTEILGQCQSQCQTVEDMLLNTCNAGTDPSCGCADSDISNMQTCFSCLSEIALYTKQDLDDFVTQYQTACQELSSGSLSTADSELSSEIGALTSPAASGNGQSSPTSTPAVSNTSTGTHSSNTPTNTPTNTAGSNSGNNNGNGNNSGAMGFGVNMVALSLITVGSMIGGVLVL